MRWKVSLSPMLSMPVHVHVPQSCCCNSCKSRLEFFSVPVSSVVVLGVLVVLVVADADADADEELVVATVAAEETNCSFLGKPV